MNIQLSDMTKSAIAAYSQMKTEESQRLWQNAVAYAKERGLSKELVEEAVLFGDKQSLYAHFEEANEKFDLAISTSKGASGLSLDGLAELFAKAAANQANYDESQAEHKFQKAVAQFESTETRNQLAYADCLNQYGRALRRLKKFSESIDVQEKALEAYAKVNGLECIEIQNRIRGLREHLDTTGASADGPDREKLRCRAARILGSPEPTPRLSLEEALAIMHEEGLETDLTLEEAQQLTENRNAKDWSGSQLLKEALYERFEAAESWDEAPQDSIIVYPMPSGMDELQQCFDYFCDRAGLEPGFEVIEGNEEFEPLTVQTPGGKQITFEYTEISELVQLVDQRLEEIGDNRRFFRMDGHEYEGVYYLLPKETKERLSRNGALEFFYD